MQWHVYTEQHLTSAEDSKPEAVFTGTSLRPPCSKRAAVPGQQQGVDEYADASVRQGWPPMGSCSSEVAKVVCGQHLLATVMLYCNRDNRHHGHFGAAAWHPIGLVTAYCILARIGIPSSTCAGRVWRGSRGAWREPGND